MFVKKEENYTQLVCDKSLDLKGINSEIKKLKSLGENIIVDLSQQQTDPGREIIMDLIENLGNWGVILGYGDWAHGYMEQEYPVVPTHSEATDYVFMLALERDL